MLRGPDRQEAENGDAAILAFAHAASNQDHAVASSIANEIEGPDAGQQELATDFAADMGTFEAEEPAPLPPPSSSK